MEQTNIIQAGDGNYYFAYVRKSSAWKKKQASSLFEQYSDITILAKKLYISPAEVNFYEESRSAFKADGKRPELKRLQKDIESIKNKSWEKIILSSIISRLARHRVVGDYFVEALIPQDRRKQPLINKIYNNGKIWDNNSKRIDLQWAFDNASNESEDKRDFQFERRTSHLQSGRYRLITPIGFENVNTTLWILTEDPEKMPYIKKAFEMAAEWKRKYEISDYLFINGIRTQHWNPIHAKDLHERIFAKTIYKWEFTDTNGDFYDNFDFASKKPPISKNIWQKAFENTKPWIGKWAKWKRKYHKSKDIGDIFTQIGRTTNWLLLSRDIKTNTYKNGSTAEFIYYVNKVDKVNISRKLIIDAFMEKFAELAYNMASRFAIYKLQKEKEYCQKALETGDFSTLKEILPELETRKSGNNDYREYIEYMIGMKDLYIQSLSNTYQEEKELFKKYHKETGAKNELFQYAENMSNTLRREIFQKYFIEAEKNEMLEFFKKQVELINPDATDMQKKIKLQIENNVKEIDKLLEQNKKITQKMLLIDDEETLSIAEETKQGNKNRIIQLEKENDILQNKSSLKKFLKKLPEILLTTFELTKKLDSKEENKNFEKDLSDLIKFTLSNYTVDNKKSLKIGINWTLEILFFDEKYGWQPH